jgi:hypothetical protein
MVASNLNLFQARLDLICGARAISGFTGLTTWGSNDVSRQSLKMDDGSARVEAERAGSGFSDSEQLR